MNDRLPFPDLDIAALKAQIRLAARRVTSYDVALAAGVSQSAVSRCFKPGASVSKATYARVMQAADALGYTPNAAARSLSTQRSNLVAVILPAQAQLHHPEVLSELSQQFGRRGMRVLLFGLERETDIGAALAGVWQHQVDGAVIAAPLTAAQAAEFEQRRIPFVLFNRVMSDGSASAALCDQRAAARLLVTRLAAAGHRRFALLGGAPDASIALERRQAAASRLAELGLEHPIMIDGAGDYAGGARALRELVAMGRTPDAVICSNDLAAIGCLDTARIDFKLDVPGELSVTGFDGIASSSWLNYRLTTVRQPMHDMTVAVADMLAALIEDVETAPRTRLFPALVVEGATARLGPGA